MSEPDPDKQKEVTAASLKRLAKAYRIDAKDYRQAGNPSFAQLLMKQARAIDAEAKLLRSMR